MNICSHVQTVWATGAILGVTFLVRISQFSGVIFHWSGSSHFSGSKKIAPHFNSHFSGVRKKEPSYLILDLVKILLLNTFLQIFHVDDIQFMFCLRFSSKIFKTMTNINSISYNFLFFHIFFNLSNLLTKQKLHMVEKIKIRREASLLFFWSENLFHQSGNEKSTKVGIPTSVD